MKVFFLSAITFPTNGRLVTVCYFSFSFLKTIVRSQRDDEFQRKYPNDQNVAIQSVFLKGGCLVVNGYDGGDVAWVNSSLSRATVVTKVSRSLLHLHPHALVRLMMMMVDKIW